MSVPGLKKQHDKNIVFNIIYFQTELLFSSFKTIIRLPRKSWRPFRILTGTCPDNRHDTEIKAIPNLHNFNHFMHGLKCTDISGVTLKDKSIR